MKTMTLNQRTAIAEADMTPQLACDADALFNRLNAARRLWMRFRQPNQMAELDRLLDEVNRRWRAGMFTNFSKQGAKP